MKKNNDQGKKRLKEQIVNNQSAKIRIAIDITEREVSKSQDFNYNNNHQREQKSGLLSFL